MQVERDVNFIFQVPVSISNEAELKYHAVDYSNLIEDESELIYVTAESILDFRGEGFWTHGTLYDVPTSTQLQIVMDGNNLSMQASGSTLHQRWVGNPILLGAYDLENISMLELNANNPDLAYSFRSFIAHGSDLATADAATLTEIASVSDLLSLSLGTDRWVRFAFEVSGTLGGP